MGALADTTRAYRSSGGTLALDVFYRDSAKSSLTWEWKRLAIGWRRPPGFVADYFALRCLCGRLTVGCVEHRFCGVCRDCQQRYELNRRPGDGHTGPVLCRFVWRMIDEINQSWARYGVSAVASAPQQIQITKESE